MPYTIAMVKVPTGKILEKLRGLFSSSQLATPINSYIVFSNDSHMTEFTAEADQRRAFISGFHGSAGTAVVTRKEALMWTDGRYFLEAESVLDENWQLMKQGMPGVPSVLAWLSEHKDVTHVGTDPTLIPYSEWVSYRKTLKRYGKSLVPVNTNLVDVVWNEMGKKPEQNSYLYIHGIEFAGVKWEDKVTSVREKMSEKSVDALVLSALDDIAWLLNLRGFDVDCSPLFKAYAILTASDIYLFIDSKRLIVDVKKHLRIDSDGESRFSVTVAPYGMVVVTLIELAKKYDRVWIDSSTPASLVLEIAKEKLHIEVNPVTVLKSIKNPVELANLRKCCARDGAVLCEFYGYLQNNVKTKQINEYDAALYLNALRAKQVNFVMNSFNPISSIGPNGAVIHYSVSADTARMLDDQQIYLCDSGGNYRDGTTDITRTMHFGKPTAYEKRCYTAVLKGHIALARAVFPKNVPGRRLDSFARQHLWNLGLDYLHGTGHGIGFFLNVHEGPQRISYTTTDYQIMAGNLLSDEPGYYEDGKFGIRIENMIVATEASTEFNFKNLGFLRFEVVSPVPMHRSLIDVSLLTADEISWLNDYHQFCREKLKPELLQNNYQYGLQYLEENTVRF